MNHGRLFALIDELRQLNLLRPFLEASADPSATLSGDQLAAVRLPDRPRLLEAYGAEDGRAFPLERSGSSILGRAPGCNILLDHDPYVSEEHCTVEASDNGWQVTDLGSSNGTWVNWRKV